MIVTVQAPSEFIAAEAVALVGALSELDAEIFDVIRMLTNAYTGKSAFS